MEPIGIPIAEICSDLTARLYQLARGIFSLVPSISSSDAQRFITRGVLKRTFIIRQNAAFIISFKPSTTHAICADMATELTMHANSLYVHIRGLFDNLAWAIAYEFPTYGQVSESNKKDRSRIGLFHSAFIDKIPSHELAAFLREHVRWHDLLKEFRDPIAHRLPMYAVPSVIAEEDADRYQQLEKESIGALMSMDIDKHSRLKQEKVKLTRYIPMLCHEQDGQPMLLPMKPQVEQDVSITAEILDLSRKLWSLQSPRKPCSATK